MPKPAMLIPKETELLARKVLDAAFRVHSLTGPGLLESAYQRCLAFELGRREIRFECQKAVPFIHEGQLLEAGFRLDFLIEEQLILELKSVETLLPLHSAQLITYLKLSGVRLGFLVNFNAHHLRHGIRRIAF